MEKLQSVTGHQKELILTRIGWSHDQSIICAETMSLCHRRSRWSGLRISCQPIIGWVWF